MDLIICFIDDSSFEHELVREEIAPFATDLKFIFAYSFEEAKKILGEKIPILFLLDLWGNDNKIINPVMTSREEIKKRISGFGSIDQVYNGLDEFQGDRINEYLKRLFTIVDNWRCLFEDVCNRLGQNRKYGLNNLVQARKQYPGVPSVFYTRKSLINDAVAMIEAGTDGLFIKPTGFDDSETRILTRNYAEKFIIDLCRIINLKIDDLKKFKDYYSLMKGIDEQKVEKLIKSWKEFKKNKTYLNLP